MSNNNNNSAESWPSVSASSSEHHTLAIVKLQEEAFTIPLNVLTPDSERSSTLYFRLKVHVLLFVCEISGVFMIEQGNRVMACENFKSWLQSA